MIFQKFVRVEKFTSIRRIVFGQFSFPRDLLKIRGNRSTSLLSYRTRNESFESSELRFHRNSSAALLRRIGRICENWTICGGWIPRRVIEIPLFMPAVLADRERDLSASRIPYERAIKSRARFEILATSKRRWRSGRRSLCAWNGAGVPINVAERTPPTSSV